MSLLILVEKDYIHDDEVVLKHSEVSIRQLLDAMSDDQLSLHNLIRLKQPTLPGKKKKKEEISPGAKRILAGLGWVHLSAVEDIAKRKKLMQRYYLIDKKQLNIVSYLQTTNIDNLTTYELGLLAKNSKCLVQEVEIDGMLSDAKLNYFKEIKIQHQKDENKRKELAKQKLELKKAKEIEKAKQLLAKSDFKIVPKKQRV